MLLAIVRGRLISHIYTGYLACMQCGWHLLCSVARSFVIHWSLPDCSLWVGDSVICLQVWQPFCLPLRLACVEQVLLIRLQLVSALTQIAQWSLGLCRIVCHWLGIAWDFVLWLCCHWLPLCCRILFECVEDSAHVSWQLVARALSVLAVICSRVGEYLGLEHYRFAYSFGISCVCHSVVQLTHVLCMHLRLFRASLCYSAGSLFAMTW